MPPAALHRMFRCPGAIAFLLGLLAIGLPAHADQPELNRAHDTKSANGRFVIRMRPAASYGFKGTGVAYEIGEEGQTRLWEVDWFANRVEISDDGQYVVRYGPWGTDLEHYSDLGIAFYHRGRLLRKYRVNELVRDTNAIVHSVSHYWWRPAKQSVSTGFHGDDRYRLVVADRTVYDFALATGEIVARDVDPEARNGHEVRAEEKEAARQRGMRVYEASGLDRVYGPHFDLSEVNAGPGKTMGVHFDGPEWRADLTPKRAFAHPCFVDANFPLDEGGRVVATLKPEEILTALDKAFAHPFVARRFAHGGATGVRMRITGDRLHWDTPELREFLKKLEHADAERAELRHWAYLIIDAEESRYTSLYLNVTTGEVIYEHPERWPREPVLIDATGN